MPGMIFWRISSFPDLSGRGGLLASGRWHQAGRPVVYLAETPAAAMLEVLVHLEIDAEDVPDNLRLLRIHVPDDATQQSITDLPGQWEENVAHTQGMGNAWLATGETLLLVVPSAIMPHTNNFLFNPLHHQASQATLTVETLRLDRRLLRGMR